MRHNWQKFVIGFLVGLVLVLAGYSYLFRHYLDGERFLDLALEGAGRDPAIINADEPEFAIRFQDRRLAIQFVFQTEQPEGIGSISLKIDPFRKTYYDVVKSSTYTGLDG